MESTVLETKKIGKYQIDILPDYNPTNPREDDNLGTMVCFHSRYNLGDKHSYDHLDYNGWDEMKQAITKKENVAIILPLYLYDHSGITISTTPFHCRWDSGQIGFVFISKEKIRREYRCKRVSKKLIDRVTKYIISEVKTYDNYLTGSCCGYRITDTETGREVDSCWGYYGSDDCMTEAESIVKSYQD